MPGIDGVEATRRIMGESPCAILVVTATITGHLSKVYQAMGYGALDAIDTPTLGPVGRSPGASLLLHKIEIIGKLIGKPVERLTRSASTMAPMSSSSERPGHAEMSLEPLVVLGASTAVPTPWPKSSLIFPRHSGRDHHRPACRRGIRPRAGTMALRAGTPTRDAGRRGAPARRLRDVLLSGTDDHLIMGEDRRLHYSVEPRTVSYRPSVDVFFASVARNWPRPGVAVLLTGMGRDGAAGLLKLRGLGWHTIAQDESSSVVWGMPKAAVEIGAAEEILPLARIAEAIVRLGPQLTIQ